jgi:hypothetical protein
LESDSRNNGKAILVDLSKSNESTTLFSLVPSGSLVGGSDKVLTNDYISLKGSVLEYYIGYREEELSTLLDVSMRFETRNTFKIIKNSPSSSAICQFQINTFKYLQELSAALVDYKGKREYRSVSGFEEAAVPSDQTDGDCERLREQPVPHIEQQGRLLAEEQDSAGLLEQAELYSFPVQAAHGPVRPARAADLGRTGPVATRE